MKRVLTMFAHNRLSLVALSMAAFFAIANVSAVGAANPTPFKVLRAATNANGTFFVGGSGFTVSHPSTSNYHVSFPKGTWNSLGVACYFVPEVQSVFTPAVAEIAGWWTVSDGSGSVDVHVTSGKDAPLMMTFTSANC
jgi:hypothetical protein